MKVNRYTTFCLLFSLISLIYFQIPCLVSGTSLDQNNHRLLDDSQDNHYVFKEERTDDNKVLHYAAEYTGPDSSIGSSSIIKQIEMVVSFHDKNTFRVKILDAKDENRWQIPERAPFPHFGSQETISMEDSCCKVEVIKDPNFAIVITRKETNEVLFDTRDKNFKFSDLYIELSTALPSDNVYGFGERYYKFKLSPGTYTIWGRDDPMILEDGNGGGNTYSQHPVGLFKGKDKNFFLTLMRNSNAMDIIIDQKPSLTYKMVGGIIDLIFFVGDRSPETVLKSYHNYLGNFTMMPFWSMGFHQSKWGYTSHSIMNNVVSDYNRYDIPLDVIWSDIDYMIDKEIFTVNTRSYPPAQMRELMTKYKKRWVPIIDPGVRIVNPQGPGTSTGLERDVFLKNHEGKILSGYVWPGRVYFPDFFNEKAEGWWGDMLEVLYNIIPFSGIWLDMNEVANFVDGEEHRPSPNSKYNQIPYTPGKHHLHRKTISLDAKHEGGIDEYNVHGLFSLMECEVTHKFLKTKSELPFILTRGTSMGVGKYSAHWTGDNGAHWDFLKHSIAGNFNFQIFGIPFVGADICGFMDDTNEELCARWTQLGALYPFARNHHEERTRNQEPWTFTGKNLEVTVLETTRIALKTRYALLKWYYSLFIETGGAGSVFRPLMFEFPDEEELYKDGFTDWEFLLGKGVLCTPKVEPGEPHVEAHFPKATWFDLFKGKKFIEEGHSPRTMRVETPYNAPVPMFLRAGHIVHMQKTEKVLSTEDLNNEFELIAALKPTETNLLTAEGFMMGISSFDDKSVSDRCMKDNCLYNIVITVPDTNHVEISFNRQKENVEAPLDGWELSGIKLYGISDGFMKEDDSKEGFAFVRIFRAEQTDSPDPSPGFFTSEEAETLSITFEPAVKIQDGDKLKLELIY